MITEKIYNGTVIEVIQGHYDLPKNETYWTLKFKTGSVCLKIRGQKFSSIKVGNKVYFTGRIAAGLSSNIFILKNIYRKEDGNLIEYRNHFDSRK